jgi:hypothetical protein
MYTSKDVALQHRMHLYMRTLAFVYMAHLHKYITTSPWATDPCQHLQYARSEATLASYFRKMIHRSYLGPVP